MNQVSQLRWLSDVSDKKILANKSQNQILSYQ